jgi:type IV pilus assembly protein PilY1
MKARNCSRPLLAGAWLLGLTVLVLAPDSARSADAASCCLRGSAGFSLINAQGQEPDEKFFTVQGAPPNVMLLLDNSSSMLELQLGTDRAAPWDYSWPAADPRHGQRLLAGCSNPTYNAMLDAGGFSMSNSYPPIDLGVDPANLPEDTGFPLLFQENLFYFDPDPWGCCGHAGWGSNFADARRVTNPSVTSDPANPASQPPAAKMGACDRTSNPAECVTCVQTRGYYLDPGRISSSGAPIPAGGRRADVFSGKFLNFYPPKFHLARSTVKKMVWNLRNVRLGLSTFNGQNGAWLRNRFAPVCSKLLDSSAPEWEAQRRSIIRTLNLDPWWNPSGGRGINWYADTPLAEALLDVGQYFTSDDSVFNSWFGSGWTDPEFRNDYEQDDRSVCQGCQLNAVMVLTDGTPDRDNCVPQCIRNEDPPCPYPGCDTSIYGNSCGNGFDSNYTNPTGKPSACPSRCGSGACTAAGSSACCQNNAGFFMDAVAKWFYSRDLQTRNPTSGSWSADGVQRLNTYVVAIGIDHPVLRHTAEVAGGTYFTSNDRQTLEQALNLVVSDVVKRSTSFGVSSVSTLQGSRGMATLVPRFTPQSEGEPWRGLLYRFALSSESANGCQPSAPPAPPSAGDLNGDRDCNDVFFTDRDGSIVEEKADTGLFVKQGTDTPARPLWEAGRELTYQSPTYGEPETAPPRNPDTRNIWTVVDSNDDGKLDAADDMVEFSAANASRLMPYMNIGMNVTNDSVCSGLHAQLGLSPVTVPLSTWGLECAKVLIEYYRGKRALDPDPGLRDEPRPWLLADIFHSSPVVVEPPVSEGACSFFRGQCLSSVYAYKGRADTESREAWRAFLEEPGHCGTSRPCEQRPAFVLVGSNGGFLHAFDAGRPLASLEREEVTRRLRYDAGSGRELWAFIPPDLLGTLKYKLEGHAYFVDGTAMVRDVWVDSATNPYRKDPSEFRTVAIVGERSGGQHFFALDVTRSVDEGPRPRPRFLWMWPQPCDPLAAQVGESWSNFSPKPPPIAPVLLEDPLGFEHQHRRYNGSTWEPRTSRVRERWVAMLNGGNDRALARGRGFAMVDVWTGQTYWSEFFDSSASASEMSKRLEYPIAAGAALMDVGTGEPGNSEFFDGYFDTATLGDMGGNLWLARFYEPGQLDPVTQRVNNWSFARAFQQFSVDGEDMRKRRPISYIATNALQSSNGYLRTFFGSGDRASLLDSGGGQCTLDSLYTCAAMGCRVQSTYTQSRGTGGDFQIRSRWEGGRLVQKTAGTLPTCADGSCAPVCQELQVELQVRVDNCPATTTGPSPLERQVRMGCRTDASGNMTCEPELLKDDRDRAVRYSSTTGLPVHRYYGVHTFGGRPQRLFSTPAEAETYDSQRVSDSNVCPTGGGGAVGCLVDLGTLSTPSGRTAAETQAGWFLGYDTPDERTASAAALTFSEDLSSGCVVWNSLRPKVTGSLCGGGNSGNKQAARLVQADFVSGASRCAAGFTTASGPVRFIEREVTALPPEPTSVVILPPGGKKVSYGLVVAEPGRTPELTPVATDYDMVQSVYQLELSPHEHMCRHTQGGSMCTR